MVLSQEINFLHSEVKALLRKTSHELQESNTVKTNLLSETVIHELDSTIRPDTSETNCSDESDVESITDDNDSTQNLDESVTKLKELTHKEMNTYRQTNKSKSEPTKVNKNETCSDVCKIKSTAKKKYDEIQCVFCTLWFHEVCVGIKKEDPVGIWACLTCRNVPVEIKQDLNSLKQEVDQLKVYTQTIVKAVANLSTKLEGSLGSINDRLTSVTRQINSKELCLSESLDNLQTTTNSIKTSLDQKSCQILNKTAAVFDKLKAQTENEKNSLSTGGKITKQREQTKPRSESENRISNTGNSIKQNGPIHRPKSTQQDSKSKPRLQTQQNSEIGQTRLKKPQFTNTVGSETEPIDLTSKSRKIISKSTLIAGSSILKRIKTHELNTYTAVRTFPGARIETLQTKLDEFDLEKCKTVILHVGGNDADNGTDPETFCDRYISLLESLVADDRRIVVSCLTPRQSVDLEPYNDKLKALCAENDIV